MKKHLTQLLLWLFVLAMAPLQAQTAKGVTPGAQIKDLIRETQLVSNEGKRLRMVWWLPSEFWGLSAQAGGRNDEKEIKEVTTLVSEYTLVMVVDGNLGAFGTIQYQDEEKVRKSVKIFDTKGNAYSALEQVQLNPEIKGLLAVMKPVLGNMLGNLGQNFHFLVFPGKTLDRTNMVDSHGTGRFRVQVTDEEFVYRLPVAALSPKVKCKDDGELFPSTFQFCPYHGSRLESGKPEAKKAP